MGSDFEINSSRMMVAAAETSHTFGPALVRQRQVYLRI